MRWSFLFIRLILAFKEAGYRSLSLGMAPLSGLEPRPLSSRWHRLGGLIWQHGNRVYNFQGLRLFKGQVRTGLGAALSRRVGYHRTVRRVGGRGLAGRRRQGDDGDMKILRFLSLAPVGLLALVGILPMPAMALDGGRYGEVRLAEPTGPMRGFVIYFSDRGGWGDRRTRRRSMR